jgi:L-ascorbate metabolism protein UlaG (beta-lactamase superfamily)
MHTEQVAVRWLGQSGFRLGFAETVVYVDPYLSDRVEELEGPAMRRQVPVAIPPSQVRDAKWVLTTHMHVDHSDPATLIPLSQASPHACFMAPAEVCSMLRESIAPDRLRAATESWYALGPYVRVKAVPAAHPRVDRSADGALRCVGYIFEFAGRRFYHAGDTSVDLELLEAIKRHGPIDVAFLPVNERNYHRDRVGILGNMTVREAFQFAADLGVRTLVPMHWDMFAPNCVYEDELDLLFRRIAPPFQMVISPTTV